MLEAKYGADRVHAKLIDDPKDLPMIPLKAGAHAPYANAAPHPQLMMQHWYQNEVWKLYIESGPRDSEETIIRMRGDNFFHSFEFPGVMATRNQAPGICHSPWFGRFGGINDRFAIMDRGGAEAYFTVYNVIPGLLEQGCPFHPESLSLAAMTSRKVRSRDTLKAEFSTMRLNGPMRFMETTATDIAHFGEHRYG
jgi:hypothetical protein